MSFGHEQIGLVGVENERVGVKNESLVVGGNGLHGKGVFDEVPGISGFGEEVGSDNVDDSGTLRHGDAVVLGDEGSLLLGVDNVVKLAECDDIGSEENLIEEAGNRDCSFQGEAVGLSVSSQVVPYYAGDVNVAFSALKPESCMSDLVWGKVKSHPWWPGQILDSAAASEEAKRYYKRDCYLIGYFGDKSFAWNDVTEIKPFWENFVQLEKQSNSVSFRHAVDCALTEISRRMQSGLACSCIHEDVYAAIKTQKVDNSGVILELDRKNGRDNVPGVALFEPSQLIKYVTSLAKSPQHEVDILERVTAYAQIAAFFRWYRNSQFTQLQMSKWLMENNADAVLGDSFLSDYIMKDVVQDVKHSEQVLPIKANLSDQNGKSQKHKKIFRDGIGSRRKVKRLSVLMSDNCFDVPDVETASVISKEPHKWSMAMDSTTEGKRKRAKSRLGIFPSTPVETNESTSKMLVMKENTSSILYLLYLAARNPFEGYKHLIPVRSFLMDFRNLICIEYMSSPEHEIEKTSGGPELGTEISELECRDSYWTDRIIQRIPEAQPPFEQFTNLDSNAEIGSGTKEDATFVNIGGQITNEDFAPTALILKFTDLLSIPSEGYLNEVFSAFGPINESRTEVLRKSRSAKVIFSRRADAEKAYSSAGKYSIFGPSLISYSLKYLSSRKSTAHGTKRKRKGAASAEGNAT